MSLIAHIRIFCSIFLLYSKIRKFRPPGNFASIQLDHYTAAKIPLGVGVRFFVRKMVERLYMDAAMSKSEVHSKELASDGSFSGGVKTISSSLDIMRKSLGHPFANTNTMHCIVASFNGLDNARFKERASVAARLWMEGIIAEYFAQNGALMGLRQNSFSSNNQSDANDEVGVSDHTQGWL